MIDADSDAAADVDADADVVLGRLGLGQLGLQKPPKIELFNQIFRTSCTTYVADLT